MATHYRFSDVLNTLKTTATEFMSNNSLRHSAALSYYTIFSLPPLLIIVITAASSIYGAEAVTGQVYGQMKGFLGADSAKFLQDSIAEFTKQQKSGLAAVIGVGTLIFAATTFFVTLQESINDIWNLKVKPRNGIWQFVRDRLLSFGLILSVALLLLISFVISTVLSVFTDYLQRLLPEVTLILIRLVDFSLSLFITSLLFALIYRFLPDAIIRWRDVGVGAFITALLFLLGKYLISFYIAQSNPGSAFGAAGSAIVLLLWVNYSSLIIFFGAEFTQEFADAFGQKVQPKAHAVRIETREVPEGESKEEITTGRPRSEGRWKG
ncbi:YihY/virulence factor BrkB family protein [Hymenobacter sp. BT186]|uniref:YihY/virulence factor BrkB family protein n=1 Tax=Hymenobacter telluris TaxID=2816474 RepID=A0A939EZ72_9BACT|nr:YihY/virulence factor BrkB family protein [Hymenobacter telluris]MBO0360539.1 YihY/virulence factor BrkB family protein [Hymenobacter telluris]MBW3376566.1 YihY/virulence factor BrkB family protein [Hymenobacter norwichensis]